jgi:hypothetical protein
MRFLLALFVLLACFSTTHAQQWVEHDPLVRAIE